MPTSDSKPKILLNTYKNFSFPEQKQEWIPNISFFKLNPKKESPEYMPVIIEGDMKILHDKISKFYLFLQDNFGLHGIDHNGYLVPIYLDRKKEAASLSSLWPKPIPENVLAIHVHNGLLKKSILTHEITHGIVLTFSVLHKIKKNQVSWKRYCQAVALDESIADIFAVSFKHWLKKDEQRTTKWKVFTLPEVLRRDLNASEIEKKTRDFAKPKTFKQFRELTPNQQKVLNENETIYRTMLQDPNLDGLKEEVIREELKDIEKLRNIRFEHDNSLIPSHAFYAICSQHLNCPSYQLAKIWIDAAQNLESKDSDFQGFANQTVTEASRFEWQDNNGKLIKVEEAVRKGWNQVGIIC